MYQQINTATPTLQFFGHEEGRFRPSVNATAFGGFAADYFLKDHLGNTRTVLTDEQIQNNYPAATLEDGAVTTEQGYYNINTAAITASSTLPDFRNPPDNTFNYANNNKIPNPNPSSNTVATSTKLYRLNANNGDKIGLGITLQVMAGDKIDIFGNSYWKDYNTGGNSANTNLTPNSIANSFAGTHGSGATSSEAFYGIQDKLTSYSGDYFAIAYGFLEYAVGRNTYNNNPNTTTPKAFINYMIFDEQYNYVTGGSSAVGGPNTVKSHHDIDGAMQGIAIPKNGYIYIFCSNESPVDVFFDNLQVVHNKGPLVEETHYYPFGLTMAGVSSKAANALTNKLKYNGKEEQRQEFSDGSGLEWLDYGARFYDNQVGRWMTVDPLAQKFTSWSPYNAMVDNPISNIDPTGAAAAPIYDQEGNFQGTDDQGLQGKAIVMDKKDFKQGMSHDDALNKNLGVAGLKDDKAVSNLLSSYNSLPSRPDYDGFVTIQEGIDWAKSHVGAEKNPTPENTLYLDASKLDFGNITTADFKNGVGKSSPINLNTFGNFLESSTNTTLRATVYALGRVDMTLLDNAGHVNIVNNPATDYDWNKGGGFPRNALINYERWRAGVDDSHGFKTFYYGTGALKNPTGQMTPEPGTLEFEMVR